MVNLEMLVQDIAPYVSAAAATYGHAVVQRLTDVAGDASADATVGLGQRLLRRFLTSPRAAQVRAAVLEVGEQAGDEGAVGVLRGRLLQALSEDPNLVEEVSWMLREAGISGDRYDVTISRGQGFQVGTGNTQANTFRSPPA